MGAELTWRKAIDVILSKSPTALHYNDIADRIIEAGLRRNLGATPAATVGAQISASIKHDGAESPYVRVAKGTYTLRKPTKPSPNAQPTAPVEMDENEEQYAIITSFGMFWRRDAIEWASMPKLLGMQQIGATPVNFAEQIGIYLLYDGREVIYVGRTTDRPLGKRLYEHTVDRLSVRWDRFSWFGLLPVSEEGKLGKLPAAFDADKLIPAFEAVLIEALEPRQNRKRGDDLSAVEYVQRPDPEVEKKKIKASLEAALNKM